MPSLRKRVSSYFRQLSFHNEPREKRHNINENTFVTKYLQGLIALREGPPIVYGKNPTDLPNYEVGHYDSGASTITGCYSGPHGGLTTVKRTEKHLSVLDADIDFIDTHDEEAVSPSLPKKSPRKLHPGQPIDNTTMVIKVAGHEYCVTNRSRRHSKSHSLGSISDFDVKIEKTKIEKSFYSTNNNCENIECKNSLALLQTDMVDSVIEDARELIQNSKVESMQSVQNDLKGTTCDSVNELNKNRVLYMEDGQSNSRENSGDMTDEEKNFTVEIDDSKLPNQWNNKSDHVYGLSDSLYDRNQVTRNKNGDPIADCFGIISRKDSALLAVADGVNWGEKASIAAKSAVHGSLHYLNKTIFNDTKPFEDLTIKTDETSLSSNVGDENVNLISNTREVFVCLLRAFNCAHDLILENNGMLTTLTVAVVLPLKQKLERRMQNPHGGGERRIAETQYVCCVCNVGDTLAYVYSQKYGIRELTKGSHDINCNRDMRDALGALGPVDGINPELSNLTLSITTLHKGDIVIVASDGLTDNFDPNVCRFTVNSTIEPPKSKKPAANRPSKTVTVQPQTSKTARMENPNKPPVKPPRKSKKDDSSRSSAERSSVKSSTVSEKSSSQSVESISLQETQKVDLDSRQKEETRTNNCQEVDKNVGIVNESVKNDPEVDYSNPLVQQFIRQHSVEESTKTGVKKPTVVENKASSLRRQATSQRQDNPQPSHKTSNQKTATSSRTLQPTDDKMGPSKKTDTGYKFLRSKTSLDIRSSSTKQILRNEDGIPYVTPIQRYELQLLLMEDILKHGISGRDLPCTSAKKLCENLLSYTMSITSAKRHTLEDQELYFDNRNGLLVEVSNQEKKIRRKRGLEKVQNLPGKLDHVTVAAYNVGNFAQ